MAQKKKEEDQILIDIKFARKEPGRGGEVTIKDRPEFENIMQNGVFAIISAGRNQLSDEDLALSGEQLAERHQTLIGALIEKGYQYTLMEGCYGALENSIILMVHNADRKEMFQLGNSLNQDCIIFSEKGFQQMVITTGPKIGMGYEGKNFF